MAVTGFVFGMVLLCALGVGMAAAGIIWLVVQRKSRQAKERKGRLVLPILLLIMGLLCAGLPGGYFVAISHAKGEREQSRGALVTAIEKDPFDVDTVRNLLDGGMDPDGGTESGYTPLMAASFRQDTAPVVFDTEEIKGDEARTDSNTREDFTNYCKVFCDSIKAEGYDAMIYANMKWMAFTLKLEELEGYDFWYADYHEEPQCPYAFKMWQYSETGEVPGITGHVDLDLWFQEEN